MERLKNRQIVDSAIVTIKTHSNLQWYDKILHIAKPSIAESNIVSYYYTTHIKYIEFIIFDNYDYF